MNTLTESIGSLPHPLFGVVRNVEDRENLLWGHPWSSNIVCGELVGLAHTIDGARGLIPAAEYPSDRRRQALFRDRFDPWPTPVPGRLVLRKRGPYPGDELYRPDEDVEFGFDDDPLARHTISDREIFGECYTIFWLCPTDMGVAVDWLLGKATSLPDDPGHPYALPAALHKALVGDGPSHLGGYELLHVWHHCFDRACYCPPVGRSRPFEGVDVSSPLLDEIEDVGFHRTLQNEFERRAGMQPDGPTQEDWNLLDDLLMK